MSNIFKSETHPDIPYVLFGCTCELLAVAETYHGPERAGAVAAYNRNLRDNELYSSPHMLFMSEVCNEVPDLMLRARYRAQVAHLYQPHA